MLSLKKNHITTLLQVLFVICILGSCVDDDFVSGANLTDSDEDYYFGVQLKFDSDSSPTRATDDDLFDKGDGEHEIAIGAKNFVILFKKDKTGVDRFLGVYDIAETAETEENDNNDNEYPTIRYTYVARVPTRDIKWQGSCLAVLNGKVKIYDALKNKFEGTDATLDDVLNAIWEEKDVAEDPRDIGYADKNHKYFTMTNSVYYDVDDSGNPTTLHVAQAFDAEKHLKKTFLQAKSAPIAVYVERMLAKFSFSLMENRRVFYPSEEEDDTDGNPDMIVFDGSFNENGSPKYKAKRWRIEVTGWNTNAFETQSYVFKKLQECDYLNGMKDFIWNDHGHFRSYWCEDPHYDYQYDENGNKTQQPWVYSWQYRQSLDYDLEDYYGEENDNELLLRNYSFDELGLGKPDKKPDGSNFENGQELADYITNTFEQKIVYSPENTYDPEAVAKSNEYPGLDSRDELLAGTHLLIGAEFQISADGYTEEQCKEYFVDDAYVDVSSNYRVPKHLFRDRVGYCYLSERECMASLVHDFNNLLVSQDEMMFTHYDWSDGDCETEKLVADTQGECCLYYKKDINGEWEKLTEDVLLDKTGGTVFDAIFNGDGMAMPIAELRSSDGKRLPWIEALIDGENCRLAILDADKEHLKVYLPKEGEGVIVADKDKPAAGTTEDKNFVKSLLYDWLGAIDHFNQGRMYYPLGIVNNPPKKENKTMHYGVVRNNWYRFTLEDIKTIGIPVDKANQPIVPENAGTMDKVNVKIKILNWHVEESTADVF